MFYATVTKDGFSACQFNLKGASQLQQCVFFISILSILHSSFWLTFAGIEIHELLTLNVDSNIFNLKEHVDTRIVTDMAIFGNVFIVFMASVVLLYANLMQKTKLYWIYVIANCLIIFPLGPTFTFIPFPSTLFSIHTAIFSASALFEFISLITVTVAAKEDCKRNESEKEDVSSKNPAYLKF